MNSLLKFGILCLTIILSSIKSYGQIKILSNGKVGIRNSNPTFDLDMNIGTARFQNWTSVMLDWSGLCGSPVIYPTNSWYLQLGKNYQRIGNIFTTGIHSPNYWKDSDDSIKTDISPISNALSIIQSIQGKEYFFKESFIDSIPDSMGIRDDFTRKHFGFMARELLTVLPEIVKHDMFSDRYFVDYTEVIPFLTEAIKEQQVIIENLNVVQSTQNIIIQDLQNNVNTFSSQIWEMQQNINNLTAALNACCGIDNPVLDNEEAPSQDKKLKRDDTFQNNEPDVQIISSKVILFQNNPNPFDVKTEIKYYLPSKAFSVMIIVSNLIGEQIAAYKDLPTVSGTHSMVIDGGALNAGTYNYTLVVNKNEISTKKMILVK